MIGVIVNCAVIAIGTVIGLLCKKGIPARLTDGIMTALGLCVLYIGISGTLEEGSHILVIIFAMAAGTLLGTLCNIDEHINRFGAFMQKKLQKNKEEPSTVGAAMVSATLLFCVGAMTIVGALNAAMGDYKMLLIKSVLDFVSAIVLTISLGYGVIFSIIPVVIIEGGLVLFASVLTPLLSASCIADLTCVGSLMIIAIGLNVTRVANIKVANMLPALVLCPFLTYLYEILYTLIFA